MVKSVNRGLHALFLGAQVNMLSSILDEGGWVKEAHCEFLIVGGAIRQ